MTLFARHTQSPNFAAIAEFHRRAKYDVLAKIQRVYGLSDEDIQLEDAHVSELVKQICNDMAKPYWQERIALVLGPDASEEDRRILETSAIHIMLDYVQAFYVRRKIFSISETIFLSGPNSKPTDDYNNFYHSRPTKENLMNLYTNHITNEAQATLTQRAQNDKIAFLLHRIVIGTAAQATQRLPQYNKYSAKVEPQTAQHLKPEDALKSIAHYWRDISKILHKSYHNSGAPFFSHVERLREENRQKAHDYVDTPLRWMASR